MANKSRNRSNPNPMSSAETEPSFRIICCPIQLARSASSIPPSLPPVPTKPEANRNPDVVNQQQQHEAEHEEEREEVPASPIDLIRTRSLESMSSSLKQKIISSMPRAQTPAPSEDSGEEDEDLHRNNNISLHRIGNDEEEAASIGAAAATATAWEEEEGHSQKKQRHNKKCLLTLVAAGACAGVAAYFTTDTIVKEKSQDQLTSDTDKDGLSDVVEARLGTDPFNIDTNGDGAIDGEEVFVSGNDADAGMAIFSKYKGTKTPAGKTGKNGAGGLSTEPTILGYVSADQTSACAQAAAADFVSGNYAACSRYYGSPQSSTCGGTAGFLTNPGGANPANGNPGDNTCLGAGETPLCIELEGVDEPVPVRISYAWDWSTYAPPSDTISSSQCGVTTGMTSGTCARILTDSSIPLKPSALSPTPAPAPADATTGACFGFVGTTPVVVTPAITQVSSTLTITLSGKDYVCDITAGGQLCEMWGFRNGYGNNFDSQFVPFVCPDIEGDAYNGYYSTMFDHNQLTLVTDGIGRAPQFVLRKV